MADKIEEILMRALENGEFNNLPGKGKPLRLDDNPFEDPDWRMANHILQTSGFSLPWIETGREIDADLQAARQKLAQAWSRRELAVTGKRRIAEVQADWGLAVKDFRRRVEEINARIFNYNLEVPLAKFQRYKVDADQEIEKLLSG